ncbi:unnamed protein product [Closterium sp. Naga37s-1]|nr:unnamed protein product [Closterium sp. Naga37s-1]
MASLSPAEDSPEAVPEKPPDRRVSGLDFLRPSVAPVTPEPLVTAAVVNTEELPSSSKDPQPAPNLAPALAQFTLPPAIASSSKGPQPPPNPAPPPAPFTLPPAIASSSKGPQPPPNPAPPPAPFILPPAIPSSSKAPPSAVGSSGCNDAAPASEGRTAKKARTVVLRGKFQQSTLTFGGVRVPPPSAPEDSEPEPEEPEEIPVCADTNSPVLSKAEIMEQKYIEASVNPCLSFGKETTKYSGPGDGRRDLQTQTMRIHKHTTVHKEAMQRQAEIAEAISNGQTKIDRFINADVEGRRAIRLMRSVQFLCQEDAPISMFSKLMRHLAEQDTPDIPKQAYRVYLTSQRFKYLQRVIYNTNLEVQGIHSVRWLSRGDAVKRLCKVLGAAIVPFHEKDHDLYETVTSYKFQFCLFFLAEILGDLNDLNRSFHKRYLDKKADFGGSGNGWLPKFLALYGKKSGQTVRVRGADSEGRPVNHSYILHKRKLKDHKYKSGYKACVKLCRKFATDVVDRLLFRLDDLRGMGPTKLFRASQWPKSKHARDRKCQDWLTGCAALFKNKLPGFDHKKASRELTTWCPIMESHHEEESFAQGLANFMGSGDAKSPKKRRPAQSVLFPSDDRKRKEKEPEEEEEEPREPVGEEELTESDDDRDDNLEMDQEIEQSPPQDYSEEEDNPFLSDGEEGEEICALHAATHSAVAPATRSAKTTAAAPVTRLPHALAHCLYLSSPPPVAVPSHLAAVPLHTPVMGFEFVMRLDAEGRATELHA